MYDPTDRAAALSAIQHHLKGRAPVSHWICSHISSDQADFHQLSATPDVPLNQIPYEKLNPGPQALAGVTAQRFR